jgi:hypothetical protein
MKIPTRSDLGALRSPAFQRWLAILLILSPAVLEAVYIKFFGVNVVSWDQWDFVPYIDKLYSHHLTVSDLFSQHNEHRLFFPRIAMLSLAYISNYNNLYEMYFSWVMALLILAIVFLMYKSSFRASTKMLMAFIPVSFLAFDLKQFGNILWGFQVQVYLSVIGFVFSIYMLDRSSKLDRNFWLASCGSILASYSFANGLAAWPAGLFFILLSGKGKRMAAVWSLIGMLVSGLYFYGWVKPAASPSVSFIFENPVKAILYFAGNIGSPLGIIIPVAVAIGIIFLIILFLELIILAKSGLLKENAKWLALILFSITSSSAMAIFRGGYGLQQALVTRYVTITILAIIGVYILALAIYNMDPENRVYRLMLAVILIISFFGLLSADLYGLEEGPKFSFSRMEDAYRLDTYKLQADDKLVGLYPDPEIVRERAPILEKYKLNIFADSYNSINDSNSSWTANFHNMRDINNTVQNHISTYARILRNINKRYV